MFRVGHDWWLKCVGEGTIGRTVVDTIPYLKEHLVDAEPIASKEKELAVQRSAESGNAPVFVMGSAVVVPGVSRSAAVVVVPTVVVVSSTVVS